MTTHLSRNPVVCLPLLPMLAEGWTTDQIAAALVLGHSTVKDRIRGVCHLLGVDRREAAVSQGYRRELLDIATGQLTEKARDLIRGVPAR